jgi:hypothetical protein
MMRVRAAESELLHCRYGTCESRISIRREAQIWASTRFEPPPLCMRTCIQHPASRNVPVQEIESDNGREHNRAVHSERCVASRSCNPRFALDHFTDLRYIHSFLHSGVSVSSLVWCAPDAANSDLSFRFVVQTAQFNVACSGSAFATVSAVA